MVMGTTPRPQFKWFRFSFRCRVFRRHDLDFYRLRAVGEQWSTFIFMCRRCGRIEGHSHAAKANFPVDRDK
jgi:hypothetical protein